MANHPHCGVGPSENGTNHSHLYFQSVMSFPSVLTNPLHQHLSHGKESVLRERDREPEIDLKICIFNFLHSIYILVQYSEVSYISAI